MIFNDEKIIRAIKDAPNGSELKIFFYIVFNQPSEGICGYRTTKKQLAIDLKLKLPTIFKALHWLEENLLIQEIKQVEDFDFMANPYFVMNNSDRSERIAEWSRRCRIDSLKEVEKRRRKQKKLAKMNNQC